jgi:hypothetical protein
LVRRSGGEAGPGAFVVLSGVIRRVHQQPDGTTKVGWMWRAGGRRLPCVASHLVAAFLAAADCPASVCSSDLLAHCLQEYFQGIGGVVGSLLAMTGAHLHLHLLRWHPQAGLMDGVGTTSRLARHAAHLGLRQGSAASSQLPVLNPHLAPAMLPNLPALAGTRMPGSDAAVAEGNTLGKGPMLFHVPQVSEWGCMACKNGAACSICGVCLPCCREGWWCL